MSQAQRDDDDVTSVEDQACPPWCRTRHGVSQGEDDWLHVSEPLLLADDVTARLCMSVDPRTDETDGPYVVVGSREYSLAEAEHLGASLIELATIGASATPRRAA
jgi:hypothetical protein